MKKSIVVSMMLAASLGVAACSETAQDESAEAANAVATDVETTTEEAVDSIDAATDNALDATAAAADNAGDAVANGAAAAANATGDALIEAGEEVKN
jgi:ABC-type glycerol-3-phosphate transport system substrate-binding protein